MVISMCETIMCGWLNSGHLEIVMWGLCWHFDHWQLLGLDWVSCQIHVHIVHLLSEGMRDVPKFWGTVFRSYCWSWPIWPWCCWSRCVSALCWFLSINLFKHVIALLWVLLVASSLEPILSSAILHYGLVHSVALEQVSNMNACKWCFRVAAVPIMIVIVSEVGIVSKVWLSVLTNFFFICVLKDRHFGNFGVIRAIVLPNCWLVIFYKVMIPHLLIPWGNHFWSGKYFCFSFWRLWLLCFVQLQWLILSYKSDCLFK